MLLGIKFRSEDELTGYRRQHKLEAPPLHQDKILAEIIPHWRLSMRMRIRIDISFTAKTVALILTLLKYLLD